MLVRTRISWGGVGILLGMSGMLTVVSASAQQPPSQPLLPAQGQPTSTATSPAAVPNSPTATDTAPLPVPAELLSALPGGITADQVAVRAEKTSYSAKAYEQALRGAGARVDEAFAAFLPRLSGVGKYTRLSNFTPPPSSTPGGRASSPSRGLPRAVVSRPRRLSSRPL